LQEKKLKILEEIFSDYYKQNNEYLFFCKKCNHHKGKLSFNLEKDCFKCWYCLWSGKSIRWAIIQYGNGSQVAQWDSLTGHIDFANLNKVSKIEDKITLPPEFISLATKKTNPLTLEAKTYLKKRGITFNDIVWWKMGTCLEGRYEKRIIIPSFDLSGNINYFVARTYNGHPVPYLNPPLTKDVIFNQLFLDWNKDMVLTEGAFDAIIAGNAIPLLGSTLRKETYVFQTIVNKCSKIYIALDPDVEVKEKEIIKQFLMYGISVFKIPVKPFKDVGSMEKSIFQERKRNAIEITSYNEIEIALQE